MMESKNCTEGLCARSKSAERNVGTGATHELYFFVLRNPDDLSHATHPQECVQHLSICQPSSPLLYLNTFLEVM